MRGAVASTTILALVATAGSTLSQTSCPERDCVGDISNPYIKDYFSFTMKSRVYEEKGIHYFQTCVKNDTNKDLWMEWFIPNLRSWVPAGCAISRSRPFMSDKRIDPYAGCFRFGNRYSTDRAPFWPHADEFKLIEKERADGCSSISTATSFKTDSVWDFTSFTFSEDVYAPSNALDFKDSFARVEMQSTITQTQDNTRYTQEILFNVLPVYDDNKAFYTKGFYLVSKDKELSVGIEVIEITEFSKKLVFDREIPKNPTLVTIAYDVISGDGQTVGSLGIPGLVEISR